MPSIILVYTTFADAEKAKETCRILIEEQLIACANIMGPMHSIFRWEGAIEENYEIPVLLKTRQELYGKLESRLKLLHSYECPCILAIPSTTGSKEYMQWITKVTQ